MEINSRGVKLLSILKNRHGNGGTGLPSSVTHGNNLNRAEEKMRPVCIDNMLLHSCSADTLGHTFGGDSKEYRRQIWQIDNALSRSIPVWRDLGYDVIVTADHGMTSDHWHGGTAQAATEVPFYLFSDAEGPEQGEELSQLGIAASVLAIIGITPGEGMGNAFLMPPPHTK